jgi:hypothetical protein
MMSNQTSKANDAQEMKRSPGFLHGKRLALRQPELLGLLGQLEGIVFFEGHRQGMLKGPGIVVKLGLGYYYY